MYTRRYLGHLFGSPTSKVHHVSFVSYVNPHETTAANIRVDLAGINIHVKVIYTKENLAERRDITDRNILLLLGSLMNAQRKNVFNEFMNFIIISSFCIYCHDDENSYLNQQL